MKLYGSQFNGRDDQARPHSSVDQGYEYEWMPDNPGPVYQINPLRVIRRRWWIIAVITVLVTGLAAGLTKLETPSYTASAKILIEQKGNASGSPADVVGLQNLTATMAELIDSRPVAQGVVKKLNLSMGPYSILSNLSAQQVNSTQLIEVSYTGSNPGKVQQITNAVGTVFSQQVSDGKLGGNAANASVQEKATLPTSPVNPNPKLDIPLGIALGLMLGMGLAFLLEYRNDKWRSSDEVEHILGVPTFGIIPAFNVRKPRRKEKA